MQKRDGRQPDWDVRRWVVSQIVWEDLIQGEPLRSAAVRAVQDQPHGLHGYAGGEPSVQFRANVADVRLLGLGLGVGVGVGDVLDGYRREVERMMLPWEHEDPDRG